ncbi:hypothetical protein [Pseudochryseolinea flava]|uniref:Uncharacterized protein n=1 Tax=Pseudochryseolinea flava TaxID=2059302 RepID=A0A364XZH9_9BACT|nr:hypothetical protein [Pseudochryseolinea flava]RAV98862.1 hypothetical protein DQQ10_21400 [Pseudochryseolinea flava]
MENNDKNKSDQTGSSFNELQSAVDKAKNERIKSETNSNKIHGDNANNPELRDHTTDVSLKKTGGGKQS